MSQSSYALSGLAKGDPRSTEASLKYFLVGSVASTVTLYGVALLYGSAGSFELAEIAAAAGGGGVGAGQIPAWSGGVGLVLLLVGLGLKVGAVPFHMWVPDTYEGAPTPVTALFSVGPKAAGLAALARVLVFTFPQVRADWSAGLALIATATMTLGNLAALGQENVKRMMAYSSIAQAGYLLAALSVPGAKSVPAFLFYLVTYAAANLGAFAVITWWGTANPAHRISDFQGMGEKAPVAAAILTLCFMSLAGIPPTAGFVGKLRLFSVAVENGRLWLAVFMVLNGVLSVPYYWGVVRAMYFPPAGRFEEAPGPGSPRFSRFEALALALGLSVAVLLVVGLGLYPEPLLETTLAVSSLH
jgi:NADH-quinone oxidoreductase subunit N